MTQIPGASAEASSSAFASLGLHDALLKSLDQSGYTQPTPVQGTVRYRIKVSVGGTEVRVRLSNEAGAVPLPVGSAVIGLARSDAPAVEPGTGRGLTFSGHSLVVIPPGTAVVSDPVDMSLPDRGEVIVSLYLPETHVPAQGGDTHKAEICAGSDTSRNESWEAGNAINVRPIVSALSVVPLRPTRAVVTLGDSITDGSTAHTGCHPFAFRGWPDILAERLIARQRQNARTAKPRATAYSVVNAGIGGNQVTSPMRGPSALQRFDRDVLMQPGVTHVIVLEGVNDISRGTGTRDPHDEISAQELIAAHQQLVQRAHERGPARPAGTVAGPPATVCLCHCSTCRRSVGSPGVAWATFRRDTLAVEGAPSWYRSSEHARRGFHRLRCHQAEIEQQPAGHQQIVCARNRKIGRAEAAHHEQGKGMRQYRRNQYENRKPPRTRLASRREQIEPFAPGEPELMRRQPADRRGIGAHAASDTRARNVSSSVPAFPPACRRSSSNVPSAIKRPLAMTPMRSAMRSATSRICVVMMTVAPASTRARKTFLTCLAEPASRPVSGSSRMMISGSCTSAPASATFWRMPLEKPLQWV